MAMDGCEYGGVSCTLCFIYIAGRKFPCVQPTLLLPWFNLILVNPLCQSNQMSPSAREESRQLLGKGEEERKEIEGKD